MSDDTTSDFEQGRLFELYTKYVTEPESKRDVYGYTILLVGYLLGMAGMVVFLIGPSGGDLDPITVLVREISIPAAGLGLVITLFGIELMLPVKRKGIAIGGVGTAMGLTAAGWFIVAYPQNWSIGTPDYSSAIITLYTAGIALVAGVVVMVPVITGERSYFAAAREVLGQDHPDIMLGRTDRGGLFTIFNRGSDWTWRLIDQAAIAESTDAFLSRLETENRVDRVKDLVDQAALLEIAHAAFRLYRVGEDRWRWLLMRENGSVVADSGDEYPSREAAESSVNDLKEFGPSATVIAIDEAAFETYPADGGWKWRLINDRRETLATSATPVEDKAAAKRAADAFVERAVDAPQLTIESYGIELLEGDDAGWHWRLLDPGLEVLGGATRAHPSKGVVEDAAYDLLERLDGAALLDGTESSYDLFEDPSGNWQWRLVTPENRRIVTGNGSGANPGAVRSEARAFRDLAPGTDIVEIRTQDFEVYQANGHWHWRLVDSDRAVRAESVEAYDSEEQAASAIDRLRQQAPDADLIEFETAAFQIYESEEGGWRWRLIDEDGNVLADSSEGEYDSRDGATAAMATLKEYAPEAEQLEIETAAFELFEDPDEGWGWRLVDDIGETIARGSRRYPTRDEAHDDMDALRGEVEDVRGRVMSDGIFQVYQDGADEWWWRFVRPDGTDLAESPEGFGTRHEAEDAIDELVDDHVGAGIAEVGQLAVVVDESGEDWTWRFVDQDRIPIAESTRQYETRNAARQAIGDVQSAVDTVTVFEIRDAAFFVTDGEWTWALFDEAHEEVAVGAESFDSLEAAEANVDTVTNRVDSAGYIDYEGAAFEVHDTDDGWQWRLIDEARNVISASTETYESKQAVEETVEAIREELTEASILEIERAAFEFHEDTQGWRWRLIDESGNELAESLQAYESRTDAREAMTTVKDFAPEAWTSVAD